MKRIVGAALVGVTLAASMLAAVSGFAHSSDSGCTPRNHPTPVPSDATTVEQTGTQVWMKNGTVHGHGSTGNVSINTSSGEVTLNPSPDRFTGTPADGTQVEDVFDNSSLRVSPNGTQKACVEVGGNKVEP